jgi:hypothetical protein
MNWVKWAAMVLVQSPRRKCKELQSLSSFGIKIKEKDYRWKKKFDCIYFEEIERNKKLMKLGPYLEWSLFWSLIGSGDKGEEDKIVAFLSALDEEHRRWDKLRGVCFRSLRLICFVGCFCRVGGEAVASCILRVY